MTAAREGQTAVLLHGGQVLVMGGSNSSGALSSAELFNPSTGKFTATGDMGAARALFTATALPDGEALVTGGEVGGAVTSSAELFNPVTGAFSPTGSMTVPRERGTATLLQNGQVLVAGGDNSSGDLSSAELYNPTTRTFSPTGSMTVARPTANATLLGNGQVLVAGGATCCNNGCCSGGSAELYNPDTGNWALTGSMSFPRYGPLAGLLPNGQVLEICNISDPEVPRCGTELYNPASGTWSQDGAASPSAEESYAYTMLNNGEVLISGGQNVWCRPADACPAVGRDPVRPDHRQLNLRRQHEHPAKKITRSPCYRTARCSPPAATRKTTKARSPSPPAPNSSSRNLTRSSPAIPLRFAGLDLSFTPSIRPSWRRARDWPP
jgi:hypothetical protein